MPTGLYLEKYVVVCQNTRQAKDLYERLIAFYKTLPRMRPFRINNEKKMFLSNGFESFMFVPQRKMCDISYGLKGIQCTLVPWKMIDKWLDKCERERIEKEKQNDHIES